MPSLNVDPRRYEEFDPERRPSLRWALVPVLALVVFLGVGSGYLGLSPHAPLLWTIVLTGLVGYAVLGFSWEELYEGVASSLLMGLQAILIIFVVYAVISTWIAAGTIPAIMYYGLGLLTPEVFLPITALFAGVVAFAIGSSWTTVGTLGVAFIGIGHGLGIPSAMTAGAIVSGAYAGDKQSPLSDTTNLAAAVTNTDLYDHIERMRVGTAVAFGLAVVAYAVLGLRAGGAIPAGQLEAIRGALASTYDLSVLAFLPLVVTFALALRGYPALPTLVAGVFAGVLTTVGLQGVGFVDAWGVFLSGTAPETGMELVNGLLVSGGLSGSAWTITVVVLALTLGGVLEATGVLAVLAHHLTKLVWSAGSLVVGTEAAAITVNALSAQQYMSIVVPGMTLRNAYDDFELDSSNLSRAIEAAGTPTGVFFPWHAGAVFMAGALNFETSWAFAPYYFFGMLSPLVLLAMAVVGYDFVPKTDAATTSAD
ncbi:Na+/H+ antiporter NhaC family protein [Halarchaeum grantii]|nr:Na+/H+ antiporter NhaC family protein [Halarchaeum grantii]